jgi:hypothetical protein
MGFKFLFKGIFHPNKKNRVLSFHDFVKRVLSYIIEVSCQV